MISNIFFSLMVAEKCFVTRYAVKFVNIIWYTFDTIFCIVKALLNFVVALLNFVLYLEAHILARLTSDAIFLLMV